MGERRASRMQPDRVDDVMTFALCVAAESEDARERELGPIHLIKYVYLADLVHAQATGQSFTGAAWQFFHFGPWSPEVAGRIDPLVLHLGVGEREFEGAEGQGSRYAFESPSTAEEVLADLERGRRIPSRIAAYVRRWVREFGANTVDLLHFVYQTPPMLQARPHEWLDLTTPVPELEAATAGSSSERPMQPSATPVSVKAAKRRRAKIDAARAEVQARLRARLEARRARKSTDQPPPRYDEIYAEGVAWLEALGGPELEETEGELVVDPSIWEEPRGGRLP